MTVNDFKELLDTLDGTREIERIDIIKNNKILNSFILSDFLNSDLSILLKLSKNEIIEFVSKKCFEIKKETDLSKKIKLYSNLLDEVSLIKTTKNNMEIRLTALRNLRYKRNTYIQRLKNIEEKENLKDLSIFQLLEKYKNENPYLRSGQIMSNLESEMKQCGFDLYHACEDKIKKIIIQKIIENKVSRLKNGK